MHRSRTRCALLTAPSEVCSHVSRQDMPWLLDAAVDSDDDDQTDGTNVTVSVSFDGYFDFGNLTFTYVGTQRCASAHLLYWLTRLCSTTR